MALFMQASRRRYSVDEVEMRAPREELLVDMRGRAEVAAGNVAMAGGGGGVPLRGDMRFVSRTSCPAGRFSQGVSLFEPNRLDCIDPVPSIF